MVVRVLPHAAWIPLTMLVVSILGFADATYLTIEHYTSASIPCSITHGCEVVTTSAYSEILGVPVALLGALYYLSVFVLVFAAIDSGKKTLLRYAGLLTLAGLLASAWFTFVQAFLLNAFCQWCLGSAITSTALFVLGFLLLPRALARDAASTAHPENKEAQA